MPTHVAFMTNSGAQAVTAEEISLKEGDSIEIERRFENGWWIGTNRATKTHGIFPGRCVECVS